MSGTAEFVQGWYADPHGGGGLRWWDGASWTDHVATEPIGPAADATDGTNPAGSASANPAVERATIANPLSAESDSDSDSTGPVRSVTDTASDLPAADLRAAGSDAAESDTAPSLGEAVSAGEAGSAGRSDSGSIGIRPLDAAPAVDKTVAAAAGSAHFAAPVAEQTVVVMRKPAVDHPVAAPAPATASFPVAPEAVRPAPVPSTGAGSSTVTGGWTGYDQQSGGFPQPGPYGAYGAQPAQPAPQYPYAQPSAPAAWLPDPHGPGLRWWDGSTWTAHTAPSPHGAPGGNTVNVNGGSTTVVVGSTGKSVGVAFLLTFFFGPIGLLYATVTGGLIMIGVELFLLVLGIVTFGLAWLLFGFTWVICIVWGCVAAGKQTPVQVVHH